MKEVRTPEAIYYPVTGCMVCQELFREFLIFCFQHEICYKLERDVKNTFDEPVIKFDNRWFRGDDLVKQFKEAWEAKRGQDAV